MRKFFLFILVVLGGFSFGQSTFPTNGMKESSSLYAILGANVVTRFDAEAKQVDLLVQDGEILAIGSNLKVPDHAVRVQADGKYIYPGFIDLLSSYGLKETSRSKWDPFPQYESETPGAFAWNECLKPEYRAAEDFEVSKNQAEGLRKKGFTAVLAHREDGLARGSGVFLGLNSTNPHTAIIKPKASGHLSFFKGSSRQAYPSSLMGMMALLKQTYLDAEWYAAGGYEEETNLSLEAWNELKALPTFFKAGDYLSSLRAAKLGNEFNQSYVFYGSGDEYKRLKSIKATGAAFVLPLNFPAVYDVEDPRMAEFVPLSDMKHWELAPANPAFFEKEGIPFALTADGSDDFWGNLRKALEHGLSEKMALKALTYNPARFLNLTEDFGSLNRGKKAHFIITSSPIFESDMVIMENWSNGERMVFHHEPPIDLRGNFDLSFNGINNQLEITGSLSNPKASLWLDSTQIKGQIKVIDRSVQFSFYHDSLLAGTWRFSGHVFQDHWAGSAVGPDGVWKEFEAKRTAEFQDSEEDEAKESATRELGEIWYPLKAYGQVEIPEEGNLIFRNATLWTNEETGILEGYDLAISKGKIIGLGKNLDARATFKGRGGKVQEIDASGLHLTSGIIDEHSHIAISRGVNESGQNSSAEVSIADVINPDDINIYRQLSGGVTAAQLLHGSANPIGGQSAIIKLRWGMDAEDFKIDGADGFIKFALGENVKQTNWGDFQTVRYPQTRMGVEQAFYDYFWRARAYEKEKETALRDKKPFRKDLEMEVLLEILNRERFISCHSYVQSEINMLMHVADSMGFTLNTFTHILEGYKVAEKMAEHGAGGSTFSDWWAYKYEVNDAIPYNAALMHQAGVVVAINSDDAEMARRLNQEAGKGVKYGGMSKEEAWKMVTLNPAKLLHLDNRMGSLKIGKDADLVLWSKEPLSIDAVALQTYVDGRLLYSKSDSDNRNKEIQAERARLIQAMLDAKAGGERVQKPKPVHKHLYHCDDLEE